MAAVQNGKSKTANGASNGATNGTTNGAAKSSTVTSKSSSRLDDFLFKPISIAPLVYFRIIFGCIMLWEVIRYFKGNKIRRYYIEPTFYFKYFGFEWMPGPLPGNYMFVFFLGMGVLYVFLILGLWYRLTTKLLFAGFSYWFFLDMALYLNHFYLVLLLTFLLMFIPAHKNASLDVCCSPEIRAAKVPAWTMWLLTLQVSIPYFFGGVAKFTGDWLLGEPMRMWLLDKTDFPLVGPLFEKWWATYFFSWGGLVYDLIIVPLLLWKKTRVIAIASTLFFHLMNDNLFTIGIFPWFMMFATPLFFEPDWVNPVLNFERIFHRMPDKDDKLTTAESTTPPNRRPLVKFLFLTYFAVMFIMPFRVHLYPGHTNWSEEGYLYSWHMMLRDKDGTAKYRVTFEETGKVKDVDLDKFLTRLQKKRMIERAEMTVQFGKYLCQYYGKGTDAETGKMNVPVQVHVESKMSLNGRRRQPMIDPEADLCKAKVGWGTSSWLVPLIVPLDDRQEKVIREMIDYADGNDYVNARIGKFYDDGLYFGTVTEYVHSDSWKERIWKVLFDEDGEVEEFDRKDLAKGLYVHRGYRVDDPKGSWGVDGGADSGAQEEENEEVKEEEEKAAETSEL